ncbi:MAG: hypothetical protein AAF211_01170 [Myxococcota bacterium]
MEGRRKVRDRTDAEALLEAWSSSGLSLRAFSAEQGLDGRSLNIWRVNLERQREPRNDVGLGLQLIELVSCKAEPPSASYRMHVAGMVLELDDHFSEPTVQRLVRLLRSC